MEQRQLRLGDIIDDYCPRERRLTNHAVVAMVGPDVKQTRCTTCDTEHEFKHAKVPRQRRKATTPAALYAQVAAGAPKRVAHDPETDHSNQPPSDADAGAADVAGPPAPEIAASATLSPQDSEQQGSVEFDVADESASGEDREEEEGPVHRPLIRASLPRPEGQPPPVRPLPEFTIRQPGGRQNRFRPRHQQQRGGQSFQGNRSNGNMGGGPPRQGGGRPGMPRTARRHDPGRKRSR